MDKIKNDYDNTVQLLLPYVPEQKGQVFFKVVSPIEENEQGKEAKRIYGGDTSSDIVFSRGVIYDTEYNNHQVLYEHSHRMENGHLYRTILGREISQLSNEELQYLQDNIKENIKNNRMIPAVITEGYDEEIGEEENTYFSVTFDKPYDEEQESMADRHECETINPDKGEYFFMDYDDAVGFAFDNISVLNQRGNFRRELSEDNQISFVVTFETDNPKLKEIAARNHGDADYTKLGNPLVIAIFSKLRDARNYRDEARRILSGGETKKNTSGIKVRTDISEREIRSAEYNARQAVRDRIVLPSARFFTPNQVNDLNQYRAMFSKDTPTEELFKLLFDSVVMEVSVASKPEKWKFDVWKELSGIAQGIVREEHGVTLGR